MEQFVEDGATVKLFYERSLAKSKMSYEGINLSQELDKEVEVAEMKDIKNAKA